MVSPDYIDPVAGAARERDVDVAGGGDLVKIGEVILGAPADTIDFLAIPQTYRHLRAVVRAKMSNNVGANYGLAVGFNGDLRAGGSALYDAIRRESAGVSGSAAGANLAQAYFNYLGLIPSTGTASYGSTTDIEVDDYASTTFEKIVRSRGSVQLGILVGDHTEIIAHGRWRSIAAITRMTFFSANAAVNLDTGSMVTLYGLK
jgi:hypothetical protein